MASIPVALTIAGSDSGGGAGIQADLRTFAFHRVHGTSALTCITAQNTIGVHRVEVMSPESILDQVTAVVDDIGVNALKTGMLPNQAIIQVVADYLKSWKSTGQKTEHTPGTQKSHPAHSAQHAIVVDPVMVSRAGAKLIEDEAIATLKRDLIPLATVVTPNRYEAEILVGYPIQSLDAMKQAAIAIVDLGPQVAVVKGGGMQGELRGVDVLCVRQPQGKSVVEILRTETVNTSDTHGTGCTLSAAIAANLALGKDPNAAICQAKDYVTQALHHSLRMGQGQGPVGHFFPLL